MWCSRGLIKEWSLLRGNGRCTRRRNWPFLRSTRRGGRGGGSLRRDPVGEKYSRLVVAAVSLLLVGFAGSCTNDSVPPLPSPLTGNAQSAQWFTGNGLVQTTEAFSVKQGLVVEWEFARCPDDANGHLTIQIQSERGNGTFRTIVDNVAEGHGQVSVDQVSKQALNLRMLNPSSCTWRVRMWPYQ